MCVTTTDTERKQSSTTAFHLSSSASNPSPTIGGSSTDKMNSSPLSSLTSLISGGKEKHDKSTDPNNGSRSMEDTPSQGAQRKYSVLLSDESGENDSDHRNSSLLSNENNAAVNGGNVSKATAGEGSSQVNKIEGRSFCAEMIMLPVGVCQSSSDFAEQMDIFMRCQHPLDLLCMFHEDDDRGDGDGDGVSMNASNRAHCGEEYGDAPVHRVSGYYAIPRSCEYCGSPDIDLCHENSKCERPKSFFLREKPPFCLKGRSRWQGEENNVGLGSFKKQEDKLKSNESEENDETTMACSAWV
mmetsp:Transcript_9621/g.23324  ORF Transcript_9621/g.23324 Transcript_9621/m.23324 type:complete len:299 (-) Transcript_9621:452-1348(-)